jgi:SAM-dependent methyltransferase
MEYWNSTRDNCGYVDGLLDHHSNQNLTITADFFKILDNKYQKRVSWEEDISNTSIDILNRIIKTSNKFIEIGCGTGELIYNLSNRHPNSTYLGTDITSKCINFANEKYSKENLQYTVHNLLNDELNEKFDISICSNCLEHFKNPFVLLDKMLDISNYALILVPYKQTPMTDGYSEEGGAGHVFQFNEDSFKDYKVISEFTFFTDGWNCGENPLQLCTLLERAK